MARTLKQIQDDIDALKAVMGSGAMSVSYADRRIQYHTYAEQAKALARLERELKGADDTTYRRVRRYHSFNQAR